MRTVLQITGIPAPYRLPLYRQIRALLLNSDVDFRVIFSGITKVDRSWNISGDDLRDIPHIRLDLPRKQLPRKLIAAIRETTPAMVVIGWAMDFVALRILLYCRRHKIPCVVWTGETRNSSRHRPYAWLRGLVRIPFFRLASGFITYGTSAAEYVRLHGVKPEIIFTALNSVDTSFFRESVGRLHHTGEVAVERGRYVNSAGRLFGCQIVFAGYLIRDKGIFETIRALALLDRQDLCLHVLGVGAEEQAVRELVHQSRMADRVFFHGFRQKEELPLFYAMADIVVFPSLPKMCEVFGLVMVEAAAAGVPVIASRYAGGTVDVVIDGVTGLITDPLDISRYARSIATLADDPTLRQRMGAAARERSVGELTIERSAAGYLRAVQNILA